jgi:hypothetical protein
VRDVGIRGAVVSSRAELILDDFCVVSPNHHDRLIGPLVFSFRVRVGGNELKSAREALSYLECNTVVEASVTRFRRY